VAIDHKPKRGQQVPIEPKSMIESPCESRLIGKQEVLQQVRRATMQRRTRDELE
jgi:hypothetical protein